MTTALTASASTSPITRMSTPCHNPNRIAPGDAHKGDFRRLIHAAVFPPCFVIISPISFLSAPLSGDNAAYLPAAQHQYPVAQLQQHVQVLADKDHGDALFLLLVDQIVDGIGGIDVQPAHRVGRHQHRRGGGYLAPDQNLLHVAAREPAHRDGEPRRGDLQLLSTTRRARSRGVFLSVNTLFPRRKERSIMLYVRSMLPTSPIPSLSSGTKDSMTPEGKDRAGVHAGKLRRLARFRLDIPDAARLQTAAGPRWPPAVPSARSRKFPRYPAPRRNTP